MQDRIQFLETIVTMLGKSILAKDPALKTEFTKYFKEQNAFHTRNGTQKPATDGYYKFVGLAESLGIELE